MPFLAVRFAEPAPRRRRLADHFVSFLLFSFDGPEFRNAGPALTREGAAKKKGFGRFLERGSWMQVDSASAMRRSRGVHRSVAGGGCAGPTGWGLWVLLRLAVGCIDSARVIDGTPLAIT